MSDIDAAFVPTLWKLEPQQTLGLALSGGGFRASFFHIGVLARLAELDLLRRVTTLSTVSGGSIVGVYYYLKVKELLEGRRKDAGAPTSQTYVDIVQEIEKEFLAAVQTNVRMRALLDPVANAKMIFSDNYSRSDRMSEIYDEAFYARFAPAGQSRVGLTDLLITPRGMAPDFNVRAYNKTADYKIPILKINATSLNSGARWTFTATDLGEEPPEPRIDTIKLQDRITYRTATPEQKKKLSQIGVAGAVASSACVPAIFTPFSIHDLYPAQPGAKEFVVELVDGGVYDNQGVEALTADNCDFIICSDASGQLEENRTPDSKSLPVAARANSISMNRVRTDCYGRLCAKPGDGKFAFFHLRDAFAGNATYPPLPGPVGECGPTPNDGHIYALSNIRTDLDAFSDTEAMTLMYDGYCLSDYFLQRDRANADLGVPGPGGAPRAPWRFLDIRPVIAKAKGPLRVQLDYGKYLFFKAFFADRPTAVRVTVLFALLGVVAALTQWDRIAALYDFAVHDLLYLLLPFGVLAALVYAIARALDDAPLVLAVADWFRQFRKADNIFLIGLFFLPGLVGSVVALVSLYVYYPIFLRAGRRP